MLPNFIKFNRYTWTSDVLLDIRCPSSRGITLIELLVTMSVMIIVTAVSFANYPRMNSKLALDLTAQDIALTIRQAQVYGTTVFGAEATGGSGGPTFNSYGVYFYPKSSLNFGKFVLFADKNDDKKYGNDVMSPPSFPEDIDIQPYNLTIDGKVNIMGYCINYDGIIGDVQNRINSCVNDDSYKMSDDRPEGYFSVVFTRPNLEAQMSGEDKNGNNAGGENSSAIVIQSENTGDRKAIIVWRTGQISIE